MMNPRLLLRLSLLLGVLVVATTSISGRSESPNTILFLCPHGGAKSVMAASYFNRLAHERGLPLTGVAAATEKPYDRVPPLVAALLAREGIDVWNYRPRRVENKDVLRALRIVAIDCDPSKTDTGSLLPERWDDVPKVSEDRRGATRAILRHVEKMVQEIAEPHSNRSAWTEDVHTCIPP